MLKSKSRKKKPPKRVLALPDLEHAKTAVLNSLTSASGQRTYEHAIREFVSWYCSEPRLAFNRSVVLRYRIHLEHQGLAPATINLRLAAVRRIAYEAADAGLLSPELAAGIRRVKGVRRIGVRLGNWLTPEQCRRLLDCPAPVAARQLRDHAMVAMLIGCGLRRAELLALRVETIQQRGALGHRRSRRQGGPHTHGSDSSVGEGCGGRLDGGCGNHGGPGVPRDQQGWPCLGRRHVAKGAVGRRPGGGATRRHRALGAARPAAHLCPPLPSCRRRTGSNPVPPWARVHPNDGALPRMQTEAPNCCERPPWHRAGCCLTETAPGRMLQSALGDYSFSTVPRTGIYTNLLTWFRKLTRRRSNSGRGRSTRRRSLR